MTLNNLAVLYKSQKQYAKAEPLYRRALSIFEQALGPKHPKVATCRANYVQLLQQMKRTAGRGYPLTLSLSREGRGNP